LPRIPKAPYSLKYNNIFKFKSESHYVSDDIFKLTNIDTEIIPF